MRPATEVWYRAFAAWVPAKGAAVIEADRAELVAEIVDWLRDEANGWMCADTASSEIEAKFGGRDETL